MTYIVSPETGEILTDTGQITPAGADLMRAIEAMVKELPVWITHDAEATISGSTKRKYATLKAIMSVVRPIAMNHGIRIRQGCEHAWQLDTGQIKGRMVPVFTDLVHSATGQTERTTVEIPVSKLDAQGMGSAISYGRRYGLLAALSLTTDEADDDGASTKSRDLGDPHEESQALWVFRSKLEACKTLDNLAKFADDVKKAKEIDNMTEADAAVARAAYSAHQKFIVNNSAQKKGKTE